VPAGTVPAIEIMPLVLLIVTPSGAPGNEYVIGRSPVAVTWKVPPVPLTTLVFATLVIVGGTGIAVTVKVNSCVASPSPLSATTVNVYTPTGTVGAIVITPFAELIVTPEGGGVPVNE